MRARYQPGSFSKNFAWHGTGLRRLYDAIRAGFSNRLMPVTRDAFRRTSGIREEGLQLLPVNFYLHNTIASRSNFVSVDELVYQAIGAQHSQRFDRLALFALHLNRAGERLGQSGEARPATWVNVFVREELWRDGAWRRAALEIAHMDALFTNVLDALPHVRRKCRANYRHLFELCGFLPSPPGAINSDADQWMGSALYLAWDRHLLDTRNDNPTKQELLDVVERDELYKLLGLPADEAIRYSRSIVDSYVNAGHLQRFVAPVISRSAVVVGEVESGQRRPTASRGTARIPTSRRRMEEAAPSLAALIDRVAEDAAIVQRRLQQSRVQLRNRRSIQTLKWLYDHSCMFCSNRIQVGVSPDTFYSEGAHIKPLGEPHNGPDLPSNILLLCPTHHVQFDCGILTIRRTAGGYQVESKITGDRLNGRAVVTRAPHELGAEFVDWHRRFWAGSGRR